jgi:predicted nucleic acid-binding protein
LRIVDSLIAATALSTGASLASADSRHYKSIEDLHLIRFRP